MAAIDGLVELSGRALQAETATRALNWESDDDLRAVARKVRQRLAADRESLVRPRLSAVGPSPQWQARLDALTEAGRDELEQTGTAAATAEHAAAGHRAASAAQAEADAEAAVAIAQLTLLEAQRAVVAALQAAREAGIDDRSVIGGAKEIPPGNPVLRHGQAVRSDTGKQFSNVLHDRPRSILVKLVLSLLIGIGYLVLVRIMNWGEQSEITPFLALYALSGVIGGVVCTNALAWDAVRVRRELRDGGRLWYILVSKNVTMFALAGAAGVALSLLLSFFGGWDSLAPALGELITMMLVWFGVGNVLSVVMPVRVEPMSHRIKDGSWKRFYGSFAVSYVVGLGVSLSLTWKVWAKKSMAEELGGTWVPMLMLILSALVLYLLLTALAVNLAEQQRFRRGLMREMIDYKEIAAAPQDRDGDQPGTDPQAQDPQGRRHGPA